MKTVTVELRSKNALRLLKDLELDKILRIIENKNSKEKIKISKSLRGSISKERAEELIEYINQSRKEWDERDI